MTGHAWPLTPTMQKLGPKTNWTNKNTLAIRRYRARLSVRGRYQGLLWEERRGQLRLSLTNTYHEWPVFYPTRGLASPCVRLGTICGVTFHWPTAEGFGGASFQKRRLNLEPPNGGRCTTEVFEICQEDCMTIRLQYTYQRMAHAPLLLTKTRTVQNTARMINPHKAILLPNQAE
jgi:hypothetical protein